MSNSVEHTLNKHLTEDIFDVDDKYADPDWNESVTPFAKLLKRIGVLV